MKFGKLVSGIAVAALLGFAGPSAGSVWLEVGDAGDLTGTAQVTAGQGALTGISGHLDYDINTGLYSVDLYQIYISNAAQFTALTAGGNNDVSDPALWLFDATGHGVYMNDDRTANDLQSTLPNGSPVGPTAPGLYYLGISWTFYDAISDANNPFSSIFPIYESFLNTDGVYGPTGSGGAAALAGWTPDAPRQDLANAYNITLRGAAFAVPEPGTLLLLGLASLFAAGSRRRT